MNITVKDNPDRSRYEAILADNGENTVAGFADYKTQDRLIVLTHTEVDPAFEGHGIGSMLVRRALDDVRGQGRRAVPVCPFVRGWIDRHPDYADLVRPPS
jgi:predicted GNAT family acetyltransferase